MIDKQFLEKLESSGINHPIDLILVAAEMAGWKIALPAEEDENGEIHGMVIGTDNFIDENVVDIAEFQVFAPISENDSEKLDN